MLCCHNKFIFPSLGRNIKKWGKGILRCILSGKERLKNSHLGRVKILSSITQVKKKKVEEGGHLEGKNLLDRPVHKNNSGENFHVPLEASSGITCQS